MTSQVVPPGAATRVAYCHFVMDELVPEARHGLNVRPCRTAGLRPTMPLSDADARPHLPLSAISGQSRRPLALRVGATAPGASLLPMPLSFRERDGLRGRAGRTWCWCGSSHSPDARRHARDNRARGCDWWRRGKWAHEATGPHGVLAVLVMVLGVLVTDRTAAKATGMRSRLLVDDVVDHIGIGGRIRLPPHERHRTAGALGPLQTDLLLGQPAPRTAELGVDRPGGRERDRHREWIRVPRRRNHRGPSVRPDRTRVRCSGPHRMGETPAKFRS